MSTYFVVGIHGAPTPETAPHGYMYRITEMEPWRFARNYTVASMDVGPKCQWFALAPPTEQAPPPEPVARWTSQYDNRGMWVLLCERSPNFTKDEAAHILKTLNTLDRDGVAWGPGRPMSELPETGRVLVRHNNGEAFERYVTGLREQAVWRCWWPLPLPGEAQ